MLPFQPGVLLLPLGTKWGVLELSEGSYAGWWHSLASL